MNKTIFNDKREKMEYKYGWVTFQCPYCKTDILYSADLWKHENKKCTTANLEISEVKKKA